MSLTFDDALENHLDVVIPLLEAEQMAGTFYVTLGAEAFWRRNGDWTRAAQRGHELGNHSIFHPAVWGKSYVTQGNALENYTLDRMRLELEAGNRILSGLDGERERTFAYPCSNPILGRRGWVRRALRVLGLEQTRVEGWALRWRRFDPGSKEKNYAAVVRDLFLAARGGGSLEEIVRCGIGDRYQVRCMSGDGKSGEELTGALARCLEAGVDWWVLLFHQIGHGDRLSCSPEAFGAFLGALKHCSGVEVETFREAARRRWV